MIVFNILEIVSIQLYLYRESEIPAFTSYQE